MCIHIAHGPPFMRRIHRMRRENIEVECQNRRCHKLSGIETKKKLFPFLAGFSTGRNLFIPEAHVVCTLDSVRLGDCTVFVLLKYYLPFGTHREKKRNNFFVFCFRFVVTVYLFYPYVLLLFAASYLRISFQCSYFCLSSSPPFCVCRLSGHLSNGNTHHIHWKWTEWASENCLRIYIL